MNVKSVVFALVFACSVTAGAHVLIRESQVEPAPKPTQQVVQVADQIERGQPLTAKQLKLVKVDAEAVPPGAVLDLKTALDRTARSTILPGILLETQLMQQGGSGLPALIPQDRVAHTIKVPSASTGLLPFIRPKDRIDVQLILAAQASSSGRKSRGSRVVPLLNNVEVLAVGARLSDYNEKDDESKSKKAKVSSIALLLTKRQSMQLGLGESKGELLITMCNARGSQSTGAQVKEVTWNELLGEEPEDESPETQPVVPVKAATPATPVEPDTKPQRPKTAKIVVYYGTQRREHSIPASASQR